MLYQITEERKRYLLIDKENGRSSPIFGWKCFTCLRYLKTVDFYRVSDVLFAMTEIEDEDVADLNKLIFKAEKENGRYGYEKRYTPKTGRPKKIR